MLQPRKHVIVTLSKPITFARDLGDVFQPIVSFFALGRLKLRQAMGARRLVET
jgi:hypothetical protein